NPSKGVELVKRHCQPTTGRHSLQLEINKALYWDEQNHCRNRNYENLKADIETLIEFCADYVRANLNQMAAD
ncbi:MAG: N-formylglutamate amidohydrolase, partial [Pseudomonadota bacterium]|nr:N-formylglutamate amidohydrolase [Pseudomonadota bacterium]